MNAYDLDRLRKQPSWIMSGTPKRESTKSTQGLLAQVLGLAYVPSPWAGIGIPGVRFKKRWCEGSESKRRNGTIGA